MYLLKEFKGSPDSTEYQNAYERICEHSFTKKITENPNNKGFGPSFHSESECVIYKLFWYGLDSSHPCLKKATEYTEKLLLGKEPHDWMERQDNIHWWPEMFMSLCISTTLSILDNAVIENFFGELHDSA